MSTDDWLAANVPGAEPPFEHELIAAGGSNLTYRVRDAAGHQWALRRPPASHGLPTAHDMGREWRIISALAATPVPVPQPVAFSEDGPFYVMEFVEGLILRTSAVDLTPDQAEAATESLLATQIAFHTLDIDAVGLGELGKRDDYTGRQLRRWRTQIERADARPLPIMVELHDRLAATKPTERARPGLVHGDYRFDNTVLGAGMDVIAVLDWELATLGDPVADFAWSLEYWADPGESPTFLRDPPTFAPVFPRRAEVARRYAERSGFDLSDLPWYRVFSWWKQACIVEGVYARHLRGAVGGGGGSGNPATVAAHADELFARAAELAAGVL
jgi:aminoglycoside phosphotransferase (APT) family kinase protein